VKAGLKNLTQLDPLDKDIDPADPMAPYTQVLRDNAEYLEVLKDDVVAAARSLVTACRASGQHREDFRNTIAEGNEEGGWGDPPEPLRNVVLLRDVDTRWSSIFRMIDRVLELYEVFHLFSFLLNHFANIRIAGHRTVSGETQTSRYFPPCSQ
jgi:hypothetical protein